MKNLKNVILIILIGGHDEEPGSHIEVEGDVHQDNQHTAHLQPSSVNPFLLKYFNIRNSVFVPWSQRRRGSSFPNKMLSNLDPSK